MKKAVLTDPFSDYLLDSLTALDVELSYVPKIDRTELMEILPAYDIWIMNSHITVDREVLSQANKLKLIVRAGIGLDHIDVEYAHSKNILVRNTPGGNANAVGEQAAGMLLSLLHKVHQANNSVKAFQWIREKYRGSELGNKTVGIIGFGNTGKAFARNISGSSCRIIAYDKYLNDYGTERVEAVGMKTIFEESDILSFHVPLTKETHYLGDSSFFNQFKKAFYLLNLSRGKVVSLKDLIVALNDRKIIATALDVLENERFEQLTGQQLEIYEDLFSRENVILSPHIGGWSWESKRNIDNMVLQYVNELLEE